MCAQSGREEKGRERPFEICCEMARTARERREASFRVGLLSGPEQLAWLMDVYEWYD